MDLSESTITNGTSLTDNILQQLLLPGGLLFLKEFHHIFVKSRYSDFNTAKKTIL